MKYIKTKILIILNLLLMLSLCNISKVNALSSLSFSNPTYTLEYDGFTYKEASVVDSSKNQALFYASYKSDVASEYEWVIHSIRSGSVTTRTTVLDIAKDYEEQTGKKVIFAANGDYFDLNSGSNMESYVNNGIVVSKGSFATKHCLGFDNLGNNVIGRMTEVEKRLLVIVKGEQNLYTIDKYNEEPEGTEIAIYNQVGTYTVKDAGKYIITSSSTSLNQAPVYGTSKRMTTGTKVNDDSFTLKSGQFAVVVKDSETNDYFFDNIKYGVEVDIVEIPAGSYSNMSWVIGGYDMLVDQGVTNTNCHTDNSGNAAAPRTFIGFKEDGTCFVTVVDGRQTSYSVGITVNEEAALAKSLGAYNALELDGGGSSTVIVRIDDTLTLRNKPSDGSMRKVSNAVLLVEKSTKSQDVNPDSEDPVTKTDETTTTTATDASSSVSDSTVITDSTTITDSAVVTDSTSTTASVDASSSFGCAGRFNAAEIGVYIIVLTGLACLILKRRGNL